MANLTIRRIAERLAANAESVCAHYLSNGQKNGRYWIVGDIHNTKGRSLFVRLSGPTFGPGAAGKWTDAATGEHGDLIDLIRMSQSLNTLADVRDEALSFLSEPRHHVPRAQDPVPSNTAPAAKRLFAASKPVIGTLAETYLRTRRITCSLDLAALRFHPRCFHRPYQTATRMELPALIAAVTDLSGTITAVQRTFLADDGLDKAPLDEPRRALGDILGNAVRFGQANDIMAAGEGIETMLSLRSLMPTLPMAAALTANHLAALRLPKGLKRLYIALDNDPAGASAAERLAITAFEQGIDVQLLRPTTGDWNEDLMNIPRNDLVLRLHALLLQEDAAEYLAAPGASGEAVAGSS